MTDDPSQDEEGVGCRAVFRTALIFGGAYLIAAAIFFTADPEAIPFWRLWVFSSAAPVSGVIMSLGGPGVVWTLDGILWLGVSFWIARVDEALAQRRRLMIVAVAAIILGAVTASAG